jgi:hypothetical protein
MSEPLEYKAATTSTAPVKRTAAGWAVLLVVWTVGIAVWALYLFLAAAVLMKVL